MRGTRILMVRHRHDGRSYWTLPGGGVEPGETPEQAAVRELAEETGLVGRVERALFDEPFRSGECRCFLLCVEGSQHPLLGSDPEEADRPAGERMLRGVAWRPLEALSTDRQVARVLQRLSGT